MFRDIERGLHELAKLDVNQIALALALGVRLDRNENGMTIAMKIADAEVNADKTPMTEMQSAILRDLGLQLNPTVTRSSASYQLIAWYQGNKRQFFFLLSPAFQTRFCGGKLKRFDCVPRTVTQHLIGCVLAIVIVIVGLFVVVFIGVFLWAMMFAPRAAPTNANPQTPANNATQP